jgi:hypothetical protein
MRRGRRQQRRILVRGYLPSRIQPIPAVEGLQSPAVGRVPSGRTGALPSHRRAEVGSKDGLHRGLALTPAGLRSLRKFRPATRVRRIRTGLRSRRQLVHARHVPARVRLLPGRVARVRSAAGAGRAVGASPVSPDGPPVAHRRHRRARAARLAGCLRAGDDQVVPTGDQPPTPTVLPVQPDLLALCGRGSRTARTASWTVVDRAPAAALPTGRDRRPGPGAAARLTHLTGPKPTRLPDRANRTPTRGQPHTDPELTAHTDRMSAQPLGRHDPRDCAAERAPRRLGFKWSAFWPARGSITSPFDAQLRRLAMPHILR